MRNIEKRVSTGDVTVMYCQKKYKRYMPSAKE